MIDDGITSDGAPEYISMLLSSMSWSRNEELMEATELRRRSKDDDRLLRDCDLAMWKP